MFRLLVSKSCAGNEEEEDGVVWGEEVAGGGGGESGGGKVHTSIPPPPPASPNPCPPAYQSSTQGQTDSRGNYTNLPSPQLSNTKSPCQTRRCIIISPVDSRHPYTKTIALTFALSTTYLIHAAVETESLLYNKYLKNNTNKNTK